MAIAHFENKTDAEAALMAKISRATPLTSDA